MNKKKLNIKEFYKEICKLAPSEYDASKCDFPEHLENILNSYYKLLDELDESERPEQESVTWEEIKNQIKDISDAINESVKAYYDGRHSKAFECLRRGIIKESFFINVSAKDYYRMRIFDEGEKHNRNVMFHIPLDKRTIVKTQRFSAPGYPCLYLGSSVYVCWEEMQRPNLDKCYVSRFTACISVYDLSLPSINDIEMWSMFEQSGMMGISEQYLRQILLKLPLILACMVKVAKPKDSFKPEYIIPQLFMEWVIEEKNKSDTRKIHGIAYTSVQKSDDFGFDPEKSINYVFPAFPPFKGNYSEELCKRFQLTEPTCDELERAKCPYQPVWKSENMSPDEERKYNYRISTFGHLEARLKDEKKFPLEKIEEEKIQHQR